MDKAAANEMTRRTSRYVEALSVASTQLVDFFNSVEGYLPKDLERSPS